MSLSDQPGQASPRPAPGQASPGSPGQPQATSPADYPAFQSPMATFRLSVDDASHIVMVVVVEEDGSEHDYQFDFDGGSGRFEFSEWDLLERDFGEEWVEELDQAIRAAITGSLAAG